MVSLGAMTRPTMLSSLAFACRIRQKAGQRNALAQGTSSCVLPKRRGHPLRSASKPCVRLVTSHGSSILRSIVIDTLRGVFRMPLIMTMTVKCNLVAQFFTTAFTFWSDMVDFYSIIIPEEKFTPSAFSLLFL